ncbi:hypothetical protein RN001_009453 [Aquatica leii]|uniref:Exonuclease domain-containing protein n=1 Tax=Aquatica leii TaxID=1421715 RepID=A0AAN7SDV9_9COLE|nr:hypothetical protein RN001_009453 [Aquatica leii]
MKKDDKALKRKLRQEKKCKKMAALLEISKLNEEDRMKRNGQTDTEEPPAKRLCVQEPELGPRGKPKLHGNEYLKLKQLIRERAAKVRVLPKFRLREMGEAATLKVDKEERIPLFLADIQHLLLYSQLGHHSSYAPSRWCQLDKFNRLQHTNVLIVENFSLHHFQSCQNAFEYIESNFPYKLEIISSEASLVQDLVSVPLTGQQTKTFTSQYGSLENAVQNSFQVFDRIKGVFPISKSDSGESLSLPKSDKFPRTQLLLSGWQMIEENFPMPVKGLIERKYAGYVLTKDCYKDVTPFSPMFGVDCEMCMTTVESELTRISIVDETDTVVYEELVKPDAPITNYLTRFSGITPKMMKNVTKRLEEVQNDLRRILPADAILVGQSLSNDLHALKMMHPYVIDTSVIYNITGDRKRKTKLQTLAREFLDMRIQEKKSGHCSTEDSKAAIDLVKLKLQNDIGFGDAVLTNISTQVGCYIALGNPNFATSFLKQITRVEKTAQIISHENILLKYRHYTFKENEPESNKITCRSGKGNKSIIEKFNETCNNYSFNIAHVVIPEDELKNDSAGMCEVVGKWVENVHARTKEFELCVVIFAGHKEHGNGCCFISLKRPKYRINLNDGTS